MTSSNQSKPGLAIRAGHSEFILCFLKFLEDSGTPLDQEIHKWQVKFLQTSGFFSNGENISHDIWRFLEVWKESCASSDFTFLRISDEYCRPLNEKKWEQFLISISAKTMQMRQSVNYYELIEKINNQSICLVSPFAPLMINQFEKGSMAHIQPKFTPKSLTSFRFPYLHKHTEGTSLEKLDELYQQISLIDAECFLLSAGPYAAPLAKKLWKQGRAAYAVGGDLQIFFGILGNRWKESTTKTDWFKSTKDSWVLEIPPEFRPDYAEEIEGGCYW